MEVSTFSALVQWVIVNGYWLFFIAAFLEGPMATAAAGVASALGYYNIFIIVGLSILADVSADVLYFLMGYWGGRHFIAKYGRYFGLTPERVAKIEQLLHKHTVKALLIIKLSPLISVPGIIILGSTRVSLKRFTLTSLFITIPTSLTFSLLGFYSGEAYEQLSTLITNGQYLVFGLVLLIIAFYFLYKKVTVYLSKRLEGRSDKY